jgi:hypothetical protein
MYPWILSHLPTEPYTSSYGPTSKHPYTCCIGEFTCVSLQFEFSVKSHLTHRKTILLLALFLYGCLLLIFGMLRQYLTSYLFSLQVVCLDVTDVVLLFFCTDSSACEYWY